MIEGLVGKVLDSPPSGPCSDAPPSLNLAPVDQFLPTPGLAVGEIDAAQQPAGDVFVPAADIAHHAHSHRLAEAGGEPRRRQGDILESVSRRRYICGGGWL